MNPRISIVIVNYNVRFFLEQCLHSVRKALSNIEGEVFVVDNNSLDGSIAMVRDKFPEVIAIENKENLGFSKANNQAIRKAKGEYILLLNPDTVVEEDTFLKILGFMDKHSEAGALGVKMIDGKGNFLPESKRALPTPWISFYKIFGLSWLFPKSSKFGQYHLGYLDKEETHEVEILPGAFMLLRKAALDKAGLLDEAFFMYGEDIDLSYRIIKAGYKNFYFPNTAIIHYKGESTRKSSINYVLVFYQAMMIFANKHFSARNARLFRFSIQSAIYFRMGIALVRRFLEKALYPLLDALIGFCGFLLLNPLWESIKFPEGGGHPPEFLLIFVPSYILIWITSIYFAGGYDKPYSLKRFIQGLVTGTGIILVVYSLLPEAFRFSRALILLGASWNLLLLASLRIMLNKLGWKSFALRSNHSKRVVIVAKQKEYQRIKDLLKLTSLKLEVAGRVEPSDSAHNLSPEELGQISVLSEIIEINRIDEIIFASADISTQDIIRNMLAMNSLQTDYKISPPESPSIIGSNSINTAGDLYSIDISSIAEPANRRNKRIFDLLSSFILILTLPLNIWFFIKHAGSYIQNLIKVFFGCKTWISYFPYSTKEDHSLPKLKSGVLNPRPDLIDPSPLVQKEININYARDYHLLEDLRIFLRHFKGIY